MFKLLRVRRLQESLQTVFHIMLRANSFNVPAIHSFPILTYIPMYTCAMVYLLLKMRAKEML